VSLQKNRIGIERTFTLLTLPFGEKSQDHSCVDADYRLYNSANRPVQGSTALRTSRNEAVFGRQLVADLEVPIW
jgi:hypothetical protein